MAFILVFCFINIVTLAKTTLVNASHWNERAQKELQASEPIPPERGAILAADGSMLAVDVMLYDICVDFRSPSNKMDSLKAVLDPLCDSLVLINHNKTKEEWKELFENEINKDPKKRSTRIMLAARRPIYDYKRRDDASKKLIRDGLVIFVKNGVPADTAIKIVSELGDIFNKKENE